MMSENDLRDIFRIRNPDSRRFTWRKKPPFMQRRLDYFLASDKLQEMIKSVEIIPSVQSDHSSIKMTICPLQDELRGRSYWKFNNSLTNDKEFTASLKKEILKIDGKALVFKDSIMKWEFVKYEILHPLCIFQLIY